MGAPHPDLDSLRSGLGRPSIGEYAHKSCQVKSDVEVYVQLGAAPDPLRQLRRRVSTLFLCLVAVCCATVIGRWTTVWDPFQEQVRRLAEVPAIQATLDEAARSMPTDAALAAHARGLQVRRLAHARVLLDTDAEAGFAAMRRVYADSADVEVRAAALDHIVAGAADRWPEGFRSDFLVRLLPGVLTAARTYEVPPSVTLAQAVLESGWGRSGLARRGNNLFGVKAGASSRKIHLPSREHIRGRLRPRRLSFRQYDSVDESVLHHAKILGEDRRYAHAREVWTDWPEFLRRISPRYASSPRYPELVSEIVELYALDRWDHMIAEAVERDRAAPADAPADTGRPALAGMDTAQDSGRSTL